LADRLKPILRPNNDPWDTLIHHTAFKEDSRDLTNEEVWLSQEDIWVQDELFNIVKKALESAAHFDNVAQFKRIDIPPTELDQQAPEAAPPAPVVATPGSPPAAVSPETPGADEEKKKSVIVRQRFRTPNWQLDLVLEQNDKKELTATTQTTLTSLDAKLAVPGLDLQVGQKSAAKPPVPQVLAFAAAAKVGEKVRLQKAVPLTGFAANLDDLPLLVKVTADKSEPALKAGTVRQRFRNPNWELEFLIQKTEQGQTVISPESKLTNVNATRRTQSLAAAQFLVRQGDRSFRINMLGEWLAWENFAPLQQSFPVLDVDANPIEVDEVFTPYTSPIKYLNAIQFPGGAGWEKCNSHRTANLVAKSATQFVEPPKEAAPPPGGQPGMTPGGPAGPGALGSAPGGIPGPGGPGGSASDTSKTHNGLVRNRYISVTEQVRHMPVALSLVVEQAHMQDLLTAVTNSRLRIQITQVQWKRAEGIKIGPMVASGSGGPEGPGSIPGPPGKPGGPGSIPGPPSGGRPGGGIMSPPGGGRTSGSGPASPGPGSTPGRTSGAGPKSPGPGVPAGPGYGTPRGGTSSTTPVDDTDPNLVEVAVYGIAALYERYHEWFKVTDASMNSLRDAGMPDAMRTKLTALKKDKESKRDEFVKELAKVLDKDEMQRFGTLVMSYAESGPPKPAQPAAGGAAEQPAPQPPK